MEKDCRVPTSVFTGAEQVVLERGALRVEIALRPFAITVRRAGRRLLRAAGVWVADGTANDHFVQFTEGVVPNEDLAPAERALRAEHVRPIEDDDGVALGLVLQGGRRATLTVAIVAVDQLSFELVAEGT